MSADAKIWREDENEWWRGIHDGPCIKEGWLHGEGDTSLSAVMASIETCCGRPLRWDFRMYPDNKIGLVGYV